MKARGLLSWAVVVMLVAAVLRLVAFGGIPPGLYHDEAYHGLDALSVLRGCFPLYFPANNGREPLFIYLVALAVGLLGRSPFALRLASCFAGLLTVAATAAMGRALFSRRVGLLAAAVLAVTLWHVHLSRVGFRAVLLPLFTALAVWQAAQAIRKATQSPIPNPSPIWPHWLAAGVLYGVSFYTYIASLFTPIALAAFAVYILTIQLVTRNPPSPIPNIQSLTSPPLSHGIALATLAALATVAPLAIYAVGQPDVAVGRPDQVSVFNPLIHGGDLWATLGAHTLRTLGMFFVRGDRIWRHNVPWRPVFDPLLGIAFLVGLAVALRRARRDPAAGFILIWTALMSLPTLLAEDAPHFLRAVGVLPVVVLLPALGLDWLADRVREPRLRLASVSLPLLFALTSTALAYFGDYARDPMTGYWFERGAVGLTGRINGFLGTGWDGERMLHGGSDVPSTATAADRQVYLDPRLWDEWPQVRFLVATPEAITLDLDQATNRQSSVTDLPVAVFVWPYEDWQRAWALLPTPAEVTVEEGPLSQGDRDPEPYMTYRAFFAIPPDPALPALARLSNGVELLGVELTPAGDSRSRVRLRWRATAPLAEDYVVFLHYLRDGERIAQADARPADGHYPTPLWHPGDVVNDDHFVDVAGVVPGRDVLRFGIWQPESGAVLYLLDEAGNPAADWIEIPLEPF